MKRIIVFLCISLAHLGFCQIPADSLKGYYKFNGDLLDYSGNSNHIVNSSGGYTTDRFSDSNSAFNLDGIDDSLVIPIPEFSPITGDFAISVWYKTNSPLVMNLFSSKQFPSDTTNNFEIQLNSHDRNFLTNPWQLSLWYQTFVYWNGIGNIGNAVGEGSAGAFTKGEWCHFVITRTADTLRIYRNHVLYFNSMDGHYNGTLGDAVDLLMSASPHRFKGAIDDLRLYNRYLTQAEVDLLWFEHRPFVFNDPKPTDAYVLGSTLFANWQYDTSQVSDSIVVQYSINNGPWIAPVHSGMAYEYYSYLNLNFPPGTTLEFQVFDKADSTKFAKSGQMIMSEYDWVEVTPTLPWNSKDGAGLLTYNGKMWCLGGWDPPHHPPLYTHNEIWSSTDGANWNYEGDAPWPARHCGGWMVYDSAMWVVGGDPQSGCLADVWSSTDGINWTLMQDTISAFYAKKHNTNYAPLADKMLMMGGSSCGLAMPVAFSEVWESSDGVTWNQLPNAPWSGRSMQINYCVDDSGALWILGGAGEHDRRSYNDVWKSSDGVHWTLVNESAPWRGRYWHTVVWFDHKIWLMGGVATGSEMNDVWYSGDGITWHEFKTTTSNLPSGTRHAQSTTVYDNALWYMCGMNTNNAWKIVNATQVNEAEELSQKERVFRIYPNPADQSFNLVAPNDWEGSVEILDNTGKIVLFQQELFNHSTLHVENLKGGMYTVRFYPHEGGNQASLKLMLLK